MMAAIIVLTPIPVAPVTMTPAAMVTPMAMAPTVAIAATTVAVAPPAAIARLFNEVCLVDLQRQHAVRQRARTRAGRVDAKCHGHRAAEHDDRKQFPHPLS